MNVLRRHAVTGLEEDHAGGKQELPSSGRKSAGSGLGVRPRRRTIIAAMAALVLLPIEASDAGWLSDIFKGSSKPDKSAKQATSPKHATVAKRAAPRRSRATPAKPAASPKPRNVRLAALGPVALEPFRFQTGRTNLRSREIPDRRGCRTYRRIGRREQRPQRRRVSLQSSAGAADRADIEGRRLYRDPVAADRGQGQAQPGQARCRGQRSAGQSLPVDPPRFRAHQIPRGVGVRGQEKPFQRPLQRLFRVRLAQKSGLQDEPRLRRTGRPRKSRPSACPMPSNTASRSWAGTGTRC